MGNPGPEGSIDKLASAALNKDIYDEVVNLLGTSAWSVHLAATIHGGLFLPFLFLAGRRLFGSSAALLALGFALLALGFALLAPIMSLGQVVITPDAPLRSGWAAALYFPVRAIDVAAGGYGYCIIAETGALYCERNAYPPSGLRAFPATPIP